jgi:hypothetical protein
MEPLLYKYLYCRQSRGWLGLDRSCCRERNAESRDSVAAQTLLL